MYNKTEGLTLRNVPSDFHSDNFNGGKWLRFMRHSYEPELTQVRLAKLSGLNQKDISRLETGMIEKISLEDAARLAWVFGLSLDDLARVFGVWR